MKKKLLSSVVATSVAASTLLLVPLSAQGAPPPAVNASATPVVDGGVVLSWPAAVGATAYKVEVAADPNFTTILESENVYGRSYTPRKYHGVDSPRTVYWRVAHYTNYTSESSLQPWSSTKEILYPAVSASSVGAPTAGQVLAYPDPVSFTWPVVKGAVSYELQYSADGNFQNSAALVTKTSTTNSFTPEEPLAQGAWAWRVRAKFDSSAKEKGNYSGWSPVVNFSVTWKPEDSRVKLLEPTGGKAYSDPLFSWEPVAGASYYKLTVARNVDFTGLILNEQEVYGTSYVHDDTFVNGQYYWKVVAYDSSGRAGASPTAPQQFVKRWGPQAGPINSGGVSDDASPRPLSGGTSAANATPMSVENLKLSWEPLQRATSYEVTLTPLGNPDLRPLVCRTASTSVTIVEHVGNGIGSPNLLKGDGTCFSTLENDLRYNAPSGATFLWRVQGIDYAGKASSGIQGTSPSGTLVSGLSEPRYVFVDRSRSTATVPYDESASTIQDTTAWSAQTDKGSASAPEFSWKPVTGANGYEVRIYRSSGITNHVATIRTPSTTVRSNGVFSDDNTGQSYEWRVIPYFKDTAGRIAYFSALWDLQPSLAWKRQTSALTLPDSYLEDRDGVNLIKWTVLPASQVKEGGSRGYELDYRVAGGAWLSRPLKLEYPFWDAKQSNGNPLTAGEYQVRVRTLDANGDAWGTWSNVRSFTVAPKAPTGVTATKLSATSVKLEWNAAPVSVGYKVQMQKDSGGWTDLTSSWSFIKQTAYTVSDLAPGTYRFRVLSKGKGDNAQVSPWSAVATVDLPASSLELTTPASAVLSEDDRVLRWKPVAGASRYLVQLGDNPNSLTSERTVETVSPFFAPQGNLSYGKQYYWRVVAVAEKTGYSTSDRTVLATSPSRAVYFRTVPSAVSLSSPTVTPQGHVTVTWEALTGAKAGTDGPLTYSVRYREADQVPAQEWTTVTTRGEASSYTFSNLAEGRTYEFQVAAANSEGQAPWSSSRIVTTAKKPAAVEKLTASGSTYDHTTLSVTWTAPTLWGAEAITGYTVRWREASGGKWSTATTTERSYKITNLQAGTAYVVEVTARNGLGEGSAAVAQGKTGGTAPLKAQPSSWVANLKKLKKVGGKKKVGKVVKVAAVKFSAAGKSAKPSVSYRWHLNGKAIKGKKGSKRTLKLKKGMKGKKVQLRITLKKAGYAPRVISTKAVKVR